MFDEEESNVIEESAEKEPTEPPRVESTPTSNDVPTDSTIYAHERKSLDPFLRPGILAGQ